MTNRASRCAKCGDDKPAIVRVPRVVAWVVIPLAWMIILGFGSVLAILVPVNLVLIPCWLMVGSSLGPLARELFDPQCGTCGETRGSIASTPSTQIAKTHRREEGERGRVGRVTAASS